MSGRGWYRDTQAEDEVRLAGVMTARPFFPEIGKDGRTLWTNGDKDGKANVDIREFLIALRKSFHMEFFTIY